MTDTLCPCGSALPYEHCCGVYHNLRSKPKTAEALMRSRYSAFVKHLSNYLVDTLLPAQRGADEKLALEKSFQNIHWLGLNIISTSDGQASDQQGTVEFIARYRDQASNHEKMLHERSRFSRVDDQWYYVDGNIIPQEKIGRNDPCWCGSGKKFKKCHG